MKKRFVLNGRNEYDGSPSHFCFDVNVTEKHINKRGNIEIVIRKFPPDFVPFFRSRVYVFNDDGVCISHLPSKNYKYHEVNAVLN